MPKRLKTAGGRHDTVVFDRPPLGGGAGPGAAPAYGVAYGSNALQGATAIPANADVPFTPGATPFPNQGFTSVPGPGGTTFVVATTGDYEFDFYVAGDPSTLVALVFAIFIGGVSAGPNYEFVGANSPPQPLTCIGHGIIHLTALDNVTLRNRTGGGLDTVDVTNPAAGGADADSSNRMFSLHRVS